MIKVNSSQFNYQYGDQIHFPYSIASLVSYIKSKSELAEKFNFEKSFVFRNKVENYINHQIKINNLYHLNNSEEYIFQKSFLE